MPLLHHEKTNRKIFYIHIPRTAGRFLMENFKLHGYAMKNPITNQPLKFKENWALVDGVQIHHAHYSIYSKWKNIKNIPSFTITRDPVDRFFSGSFRLKENYGYDNFDNETDFNNVLSAVIKKDENNWFRPQNEFINSNTKTWRYENGFGKAFCEWISQILSHPFITKEFKYDRHLYDKPEKKLKKTTSLISYIKNFYKDDYQIK